MEEGQTPRVLNKEVFLLLAIAFGAACVFLFTRDMAAREQQMEARIAGIWYKQGNLQISSGKTEEAIQSFRRATSGARDNREYALALADALAVGNHSAEAQQLFLRLRESEPENAEINTYLARLASQRGEIDDAVHYYQNALYGHWAGKQVDEQRRQLRIELIRLLLAHQQRDLANGELLILESDLPDSVALHIETAKLFQEAGDLPHALSNYVAAVRLDSHDVEALTGAGEISFQAGDYTNAEHYLNASLEANPTSEQTRQLLALTRMVLEEDPLAPRLTVEERQSRLLQDFDRSLERLESCLGQTANGQATEAMQSLQTQALAMEPAIRRDDHPPDLDTVRSALGLILKLQKVASDSCGKPSPSNQALLLIGLEHKDAVQ